MEETMHFKRMVFCLIFLIPAIIPGLALCDAQPVLIKLSLQQPSDWTNAISLEVVAYQRFENFVVAEFESEKLEELDKVGLRYQIIDREPWSEEYFLVSPVHGVIEANLESYGEILLEDPRWQLIKTAREKAVELMPLGYRVIPVHHEPIPLKYKPPLKVTKRALEYSEDMDSLVNLVSEDSLYAWDLRLQNFQTRYSYSDSIHSARLWLFDKFASFGIDSVWFHYYKWYFSEQYNVVATVVGTTWPDKVIVVGGHYDSVVYGEGTDSLVWAPGADDNGSGTVATLEMARIIAQNPLPVTVMFVPFAQEEQGTIGSYEFASYLDTHEVDVWLMVNSDMIGHSVDSDPDVEINAAASAMRFANIMMEMANTYTYLNPFYGGQTYGSDHDSFYELGYNAVSTFEGDFFANGIHSNYDVVDSLDFSYMKEVVKMCLATLLCVSSFPPVENLKAVDAGDGHTIYLSWLANPPEDDVAYYNVHFGTASGDYDSVYQVCATCDTLRDLELDTTYFIGVTAVNADGNASVAINQVSVTPRMVPLPPTGLVANPNRSFEIKLTWFPSQEADFDYYNIYRSEEAGSGYQLLSGAYEETTFVDSTVQDDVEYYYYTLTAVDTGGNESQMSDEAQSFVAALDQGILLVDETYINTGFNLVDGDSVNAFYTRALQGCSYAFADHSCPTCSPPNQINLRELGRYSLVIIHSEDHRESYSMGAGGDSTFLSLKQYLSWGGKALIEGRRNLSTGHSIDAGIRQFLPGDIAHDYLNIKSAYVPLWAPASRSEEFVGASSQVSGYPNLDVDSLRVAQCGSGFELGGKVPGVGCIDSLLAGEVIYTFYSAYDTSASEGKPVAFRYLGEDYKLIFFNFPLYFIHEQQATELLHQALSDLEVSTDVGVKGEAEVPASFSLSQNHPNPFNSETAIEYSLPEETQVKIAIYNILGQKVKTLLDRRQTRGHRKVFWDGKNEKGKSVSSGIYFYRMETEEFVRTKKMLYLK